MPGVPSGRACTQCRKQRKKCDETKPSCGRCIRLGLSCVGSGERRYKFMVTTGQSNRQSPASDAVSERSSSSEIFHTPSNGFTILVSALIDNVKFSVTTDLRHNMTWAFGGYLAGVPRRLGTNVALDAAADAMLTSFARYRSSQRNPSYVEMTKYSAALGLLRTTLDNGTVARSANTLCAVMLLMICQFFIGLSGPSWTSHSEGAAQILKAKGARYDENDDFETEMILSLRGPVLFEGLFNPKVRFESDDWNHIVKNKLERISSVGRLLSSLAQVPEIKDRRRRALKDGDYSTLRDLREEVAEVYNISIEISKELHDAYIAATSKVYGDANTCVPSAYSPREWILFANCQRLYGLSLFATAYLNCLLRAFSSELEDLNLQIETMYYTDEIMRLADEAAVFRPLGSSYMTLCLFIAWIGTSDPATRAMINHQWELYCSDIPSMNSSLPDLERLGLCNVVDVQDDKVYRSWCLMQGGRLDQSPDPALGAADAMSAPPFHVATQSNGLSDALS